MEVDDAAPCETTVLMPCLNDAETLASGVAPGAMPPLHRHHGTRAIRLIGRPFSGLEVAGEMALRGGAGLVPAGLALIARLS